MSVLGAVLIAPVLPQMTDYFSGTAGAQILVPIVLTVPALMIGLAAPFAGLIVDAIDRKRLLIGALVAYSVFGTAPLYLNSLGAIIGSRVLVGLCEAAIMTCCTTLIGDYWAGAQRARALGLQTLVAALSATVFLAVGGALGSSGWRTPFWLYLIAILLAAPMSRLIWQRAAHPRAQRAGRRRLSPARRQIFVPCLVTIFAGVIFYALIVQLSFVLTGVAVASTATIGLISALMSLGTAVGAGSFAKLSRFTPERCCPSPSGSPRSGSWSCSPLQPSRSSLLVRC